MADFRKWILALAVLALMVVPASAQQVSCQAAATPTNVRAEGIAELVGETFISCTAGAESRVNIQIFLNTNVTSKIVQSTATAGVDTEALLLVNDNIGTAKQGILTAPQSLVWLDVVLPAGTTNNIRLSNIRANAAGVGAAPGVPNQIFEFISVSGVNVIPVPQAQLTVAFVQDGMTFESSDVDAPFQACIGRTAAEGPAFTLSYTENFAVAFKPQGNDAQVVPGEAYNTESGLTLVGNGIGVASSGTRVFARFSNIPTGVRIWVQTFNVGADATTPTLIANLDTTTGVTTSTSGNFREVAISNGTGTAVWEVELADPFDIDTLEFPVLVTFPTNLQLNVGVAPTQPGRVAGGFSPISTTFVASATAAVPRFIDDSEAVDVFQIAACVTNLLFPYVTNQGGFDTGVAIVNTSLDNATGSSGTPANQPFNTTTQHGVCNVYYFGAMGNGGQLPAPQTTVDIAAGQMVTFALSQGGVAGATSSAASFQGYIIARCNFQYAHGFAFISDVGANEVSHGYLALVIPDRGGSRPASPFGASGEQLVF